MKLYIDGKLVGEIEERNSASIFTYDCMNLQPIKKTKDSLYTTQMHIDDSTARVMLQFQ